MIGAELFRQGPRPRAMSLAGLANWVFTFFVAISFESIQVDWILYFSKARFTKLKSDEIQKKYQ